MQPCAAFQLAIDLKHLQVVLRDRKRRKLRYRYMLVLRCIGPCNEHSAFSYSISESQGRCHMTRAKVVSDVLELFLRVRCDPQVCNNSDKADSTDENKADRNIRVFSAVA